MENNKKICSCCGEEKQLDMFNNDKHRKDGKYCYCRDCCKIYNQSSARKEHIKEYNKHYRETNKEYFKKYEQLEYVKDYRKKYKIESEKRKEWEKEYHKKYKQLEYVKDAIKKYKQSEKGKKTIQKYINNKKQTDPLFNLSCNIRKIIGISFKNKGYKKNTKTEKILGCSVEEFKQHLESLFESWMTWNNYGNWNGYTIDKNISWDIDHIIPISAAKTEEEIIKLNHYTNLQPLDSYTNRYIKRNKIIL